MLIPDNLTLSAGYIKTFGTRLSGNKTVDAANLDSYTTVMITVAKILEYFVDGMPIQIPSREDMLTMHKDIEDYLQEWKDHMNYSINQSVDQHKDLIISLEKLSKHIYDKASAKEIVGNKIEHMTIGLVNNYVKLEQAKKVNEASKPDYNGITQLIRNKKNRSRYGTE